MSSIPQREKTLTKKLTSFVISLTIILLFSGPGYTADHGNTTNQSFSKAKKLLERQVYHDHRTTFYCGCPFNADKKIPPCDNYAPKRDNKRSHRLEWEHIVPAHAFGQSFYEWRNGDPECVTRKGKPFKGRNCARKVAIPFRYMEADMYNLVPAIGEINGLRSNYSFAMIPGEKRVFGKCDMEIENKKAEPPPDKRGNIARTYFYMDWAYPGHGIISNKNKKLFKAWDKEDPVDAWECERCKRIEGIQGNGNPFVRKACEEKGMW
jgi:deoxyribonuclease I